MRGHLWLAIAITFLAFAPRVDATDLQIHAEQGGGLLTGEKDGQAAGIAVDVVREIQRRVHDTNPIQVVPWPRTFRMAQKTPNIVMVYAVRSPTRENLFQWVGPYLRFPASIYATSDVATKIATLDDARHLPAIGVIQDSYLDQELTNLGFDNLDREPGIEPLLNKLRAGRLKYMFGGVVLTGGLNPVAIEGLPLKPAFAVLRIESAIAFSRSVPRETVKAWQSALDDMKADGTFDRLFTAKLPKTSSQQ